MCQGYLELPRPRQALEELDNKGDEIMPPARVLLIKPRALGVLLTDLLAKVPNSGLAATAGRRPRRKRRKQCTRFRFCSYGGKPHVFAVWGQRRRQCTRFRFSRKDSYFGGSGFRVWGLGGLGLRFHVLLLRVLGRWGGVLTRGGLGVLGVSCRTDRSPLHCTREGHRLFSRV